MSRREIPGAAFLKTLPDSASRKKALIMSDRFKLKIELAKINCNKMRF